MKLATCVALALIAGAGTVHAQSPEPRRIVFGTVGRAQVADDEGVLGSGTAVGAGIGYRLTERLTVQAVFDRIPYRRDAGYLVFDGRVLFAGAEAAFQWRPSRVHPFVTVGAGVMNDRKQWTHRNQVGPNQYGPGTITDHEYTLATMRTSGGVDVVLTDALSLRAGLIVHGLLDAGDDLAVHVILQPMAGLTWRW